MDVPYPDNRKLRRKFHHAPREQIGGAPCFARQFQSRRTRMIRISMTIALLLALAACHVGGHAGIG
jgi:hypothetical protein